MDLAHPFRRGLAVASSGALVVGAGAVGGALVADMRARWVAHTMAEAAAAQAPPAPAELPPVVVTVITERHVVPDPVIVHRKVYRSRAAAPAQPRRSSGSASTRESTSAARNPSRRVVAPAPAPPRPSARPAPPAATSKAS